MPTQEDYLLADRAIKEGLITREKVNECLSAYHRAEELGSNATFAEILIRRGELSQELVESLAEMLAEDQTQLARSFGRFEVSECLRRGRWSNVYRARDLQDDREVRLTVLSPRLTEEEGRRGEVIEEFTRAATVTHPNLARLYGTGESSGRVYLSQEPAAGVSTEALVEEKGSLAPDRVCELVRRAASALEAASDAGVLHVDLHPDNLILSPEGDVKMYGLGCSFREGLSEYSSPEELDGKEPGASSLVFSLGACAYHLLTGSPAFGGTEEELLRKTLQTEAAPLASDTNPQVPEGLARYVQRMMAVQPGERPGSLAAVQEEMRKLAAVAASFQAASPALEPIEEGDPESGREEEPASPDSAGEVAADARPGPADESGAEPSTDQEEPGPSAPATEERDAPESLEELAPIAPTPSAGVPIEPDVDLLHEEVETVIVGADTRRNLRQIVDERREQERAKTVMLSESMLDGDGPKAQDDIPTGQADTAYKELAEGAPGEAPWGSTLEKLAEGGHRQPTPGSGRRRGNRSGRRSLVPVLVAGLSVLLAVVLAVVYFVLSRR